MQNAGLDEAQAGIKFARRNINSLRYANDTTLMAESEEELKSLLMKVKEESEKAGLNSTLKKLRSWHPVPWMPWSMTSSLHGQSVQFSSVQLLNHVQLFETPWTAACQASLSITNSQGLLKLTSIELVMSSNHLILCVPFSSHLQSSPPASGSFPRSLFFPSGGQSVGVSALAAVLLMNIQDWFL